MDNGKAYLQDLDIAVPIPCAQTSGSDASSLNSGDTPVRECTEEEEELANRQKRNILTTADSWDTLEIPYIIDWTLFGMS